MYCPKSDPRLRGKLGEFGIFTEGNEGNEGSCRDLLGSLQKVTNKPGIPARPVGFFTEGNEGKEGAGQIQTFFPPLEFFTEGNEGNEGRFGPSKIQSLFSSLPSV